MRYLQLVEDFLYTVYSEVGLPRGEGFNLVSGLYFVKECPLAPNERP